ncbi:ferritin family protein [Flexivirga lutea]
MPSASQHATVRRRAVLGAALAGCVATLTGCGIRLERDAPHIPGIKTQGPPPDQTVLRRLLDSLDASINAAATDTAAWAAKLAALHRAQRTRVTAVMATQGMTPSASTAAPSGPAVDPGALFRFEQAGARAVGTLADLSHRNLPMAAAVAVTQNAGASLLGHGVEVSGATVPKAAVAQAILPALRAATYALEVIVAKTPLDQRTRAEDTVTMLHATRARWEAALGSDLPLPPDGYALPVQPTSDARRRQLAQRVLHDLVTACADQVVATSADHTSFIGLTNLWADATEQWWRWGAAPTPFPGLKSVE